MKTRNYPVKVFYFQNSWGGGNHCPNVTEIGYSGEKSGYVVLEYNGKTISFRVPKGTISRIKKEFRDNLK